MYGMLTADISGCVAFSLPVQRRSSQGLGIPAFSVLLQDQRGARQRGGTGQAPAADGPRIPLACPGRFWQRRNPLPGPL